MKIFLQEKFVYIPCYEFTVQGKNMNDELIVKVPRCKNKWDWLKSLILVTCGTQLK